MKKILLLIVFALVFALPVGAASLEEAPVPEDVADLMPETQENFASDLWYIIKTAIEKVRPDITDGIRLCFRICAAVLVIAFCQSFEAAGKRAVQLCGVVIVSVLLLESANTMILLGADTVEEISVYGKLLLPVMTAALAAQGGTSASAALYAGTALFDSVLSGIISALLIPLVYIYIALSIANAATQEELLKRLRDFLKWLITWCLKVVLYIFIGYISITGVVSGATDQMTLKAAKMTISGAVPVVGGILSDASEAVIVSMGVMKNAAGIYGILAVIAILIGPFLKIGIQYLLLKLTAFFADVTGHKPSSELISCFSAAMGFLLAMTGAVCLLQLISIVCFMKGVQT